MPKNLVIVESPAKATTIEKYLGKDFKVMSSVGHIRKDVKVDVERDFAVTYEIDPDHKKIVAALKKAANLAETIWLATDEDREGESISWHLAEVLKLPKDTRRITFHEITKPALLAAIEHPRTIDAAMVSSQQARQTLDMLVGFDLSRVLWRKVPGAKSAGRVQSPALKLIVEREREIANFQANSAFKISGKFIKPTAETAKTKEKLIQLALDDPTKLPENAFEATLKTPVKTADEAEKLLETLKNQDFRVEKIVQTDGQRANPAPLTTAALQIEANSRLGFSARTTMRAAQALYQAGHITYHRTDSLNLANSALIEIANFIKAAYGKEYLKTRHFKTKMAGAQEAHEAIRPTKIAAETTGNNQYEQKLYRLIRARTLATQMQPAKIKKTTVTLAAGKTEFVAKGETIVFDGFLKVYGNSKESFLPKLEKDETIPYLILVARQTFARAPARYSEGSLVKKLEELGIGRPSTYASIIAAIQERGYVKKGESEGQPREVTEITLAGTKLVKHQITEKTASDWGKLLPTPVGELVADFLAQYFEQIVDYGFTAQIETELDQIAEKKLERVKMLREFYGPFEQKIQAAENAARFNNARELGVDPKTGLPIFAKIGKTGEYLQLGESTPPKSALAAKNFAKNSGKQSETAKNSGAKSEKSTLDPRFMPLPENTTIKTVTLEQAIAQFSLPALPRVLGKTRDGAKLVAADGPFGPYLKAGKYNLSLKNFDPYAIDFKTAELLYNEKLKTIIADWGDVMIINGKYGPYIKGPGRRNNVKIPKSVDPRKISEAQAREMLENKPKSRRRAPRRKRRG